MPRIQQRSSAPFSLEADSSGRPRFRIRIGLEFEGVFFFVQSLGHLPGEHGFVQRVYGGVEDHPVEMPSCMAWPWMLPRCTLTASSWQEPQSGEAFIPSWRTSVISVWQSVQENPWWTEVSVSSAPFSSWHSRQGLSGKVSCTLERWALRPRPQAEGIPG